MSKYNQAYRRVAEMYMVILEGIEAFDKKVKMFTPDAIAMRRELIERRDDWRLYMGVLYAHKLMEENRLSNAEISQLGVQSLFQVVTQATTSLSSHSKVKNLPFAMMRTIIAIGTKYHKRLVEEQAAAIYQAANKLTGGKMEELISA